MICLGIDCATKTGWALVERENRHERVLGHGVVDLSGARGLPSAVIATLVHRVGSLTPLEALPVAVELPYLARGKSMNVVVLRTLARFCGRWEQALGVYGADVELIMADHWQKKILGKLGGRVRADRKKASKLWASATFGEVFTIDESDAIAIAVCRLREMDTAATLEAAGAL